MRFQSAIHHAAVAGLGLASILALASNLAAQNVGPAATSYAAEAARYPDAATKPTPRLTDGHPDLSGVWHHFFGELVSKVGDNSFALSFGKSVPLGPNGKPLYKTKPDPVPQYKPEFLSKVKSLSDNQVKTDSTLHCMPPGVPRMGPPQEIVQTAKQVVFLYADSTGNHWRVIPTDGRAHSIDPDEDAPYDGDSVAHWDGDTLVVEVSHLPSDTWLADNGFFHTAKLHVTEKLRRVGDTIEYEMTADDPAVLAKPWVISRTLTLQFDALDEAAPCVDNDAGHYVNSEHHDNSR
jgi:hypothetical protein